MSARISAEMRRAVQLVRDGIKVKDAAKRAGVAWRSLYRILADKKNARRY